MSNLDKQNPDQSIILAHVGAWAGSCLQLAIGSNLNVDPSALEAEDTKSIQLEKSLLRSTAVSGYSTSKTWLEGDQSP